MLLVERRRSLGGPGDFVDRDGVAGGGEGRDLLAGPLVAGLQDGIAQALMWTAGVANLKPRMWAFRFLL